MVGRLEELAEEWNYNRDNWLMEEVVVVVVEDIGAGMVDIGKEVWDRWWGPCFAPNFEGW